MLTKIVSPETMPKNNRKMAKGQRFIMRDWVWGIGYGALGIEHGALLFFSYPFAPHLPHPIPLITKG
jgi:hypothetical protein